MIETVAALQAFRKRHGDAQRLQATYASQPTTVDFAHYRSVLKNKAVVDEAEKILREFKPVTYDVNTQIKAIETFEAKAVCAPASSRYRLPLICSCPASSSLNVISCSCNPHIVYAFSASTVHRWRRRRRRPRKSTSS